MTEEPRRVTNSSELQVVVTVVDSGKSEKVLKLYRAQQSMIDYIWPCHGTARTEMLDVLGLGDTPKKMLACLASAQQARRIMKELGKKLNIHFAGNGIAFTLPITSIGVRVHKILTQHDCEEDGEMDGREHKKECCEMIVAVLDQGYTNRIMDVARREGARGGTVIPARGIAENEVERFLGIEMQAEKEIVFLVVKLKEKQRIMTEIMKAVGLRTETHGIVFSLPISDATGLSD